MLSAEVAGMGQECETWDSWVRLRCGVISLIGIGIRQRIVKNTIYIELFILYSIKSYSDLSEGVLSAQP